MRRWLLLGFCVLLIPAWLNAADPVPKKIVLIAGPITGHGKHTHEYEKSVILLKHLLDTSPSTQGKVSVEAHFKGWPTDEKTLDDAATIVMISDGGDRNEADHPLYVGERFQTLERQMQRGCGFVQFHWTTFNPSRVHDQITEWVGGYFDYEKGTAANKWFSAISTWDANVTLGNAEHPIARGVKPFAAREEFYFNLRFRDGDDRVQPIWLTKPRSFSGTRMLATRWASRYRLNKSQANCGSRFQNCKTHSDCRNGANHRTWIRSENCRLIFGLLIRSTASCETKRARITGK